MLRYPHINPIACQLGPLHIHWYGIMYLVGFAAAWWLARRRAAQPGSTWSAADVDDFLFYAMLGVIIGGRIGYVLFYGLPMWRGDWLYPLKIWEGGMSFHGGLLGVLAATAMFARQRGRRMSAMYLISQRRCPASALFFGRIGNFINGELWGRPTDVPWAMLVPGSERRPAGRAPSLAALRGDCSRAWCCSRSSGCSPASRGRAMRRSGLFLICYSVARIASNSCAMPDVGSAIWRSAG